MNTFIPSFDTFKNAVAGLSAVIKSEVNFRFEMIIAILTISAAIFFKISFIEWISVLLLISIVLTMEAFNTAIEKLCDRMVPQEDLSIKIIKDISAGAVLIASVSAVIIGSLIFIPKIIGLF